MFLSFSDTTLSIESLQMHRKMASVSLHVKDMFKAIEDGTVPGGFTSDRKEFVFPTISTRNVRGARLSWTLHVRLVKAPEPDDTQGEAKPVKIMDWMLKQPVPELTDHYGMIEVEGVQEGGGKVRDVVPHYVKTGKRGTNVLTQALRDALGMYNHQKKRADARPAAAHKPITDKTTKPLEASDAHPGTADATKMTETPERPPPMLLKKPGESRDATLTRQDFVDGVDAQVKLNGVRVVAYLTSPTDDWDDTDVVLYSRTGGLYPGLDHIREELKQMLQAAPSLEISRGKPGYGIAAGDETKYLGTLDLPGAYLDGEIYLHGKPLNWISGQARKTGEEGTLEFHVFDVFFPGAKAQGLDMSSRDRQAYLSALFQAAKAAHIEHPHVVRVPIMAVSSNEELEAIARKALAEGFEGAVARKARAGYTYSFNNYHSANVLKIKPILDDEFECVGFTSGEKGKAVGAIVWICEVDPEHLVNPADKTFHVVPKNMNLPDQKKLFDCLRQEVPDPRRPSAKITVFERDIKGLPLTVEYQERSNISGKPLRAKALAFRTYESGPDKDPVRKVYLDCGLAYAPPQSPPHRPKIKPPPDVKLAKPAKITLPGATGRNGAAVDGKGGS